MREKLLGRMATLHGYLGRKECLAADVIVEASCLSTYCIYIVAVAIGWGMAGPWSRVLGERGIVTANASVDSKVEMVDNA